MFWLAITLVVCSMSAYAVEGYYNYRLKSIEISDSQKTYCTKKHQIIIQMITVSLLVGALFIIVSMTSYSRDYYGKSLYNLLTIVEGLLFLIGIYIFKIGELYILNQKKKGNSYFNDEEHVNRFQKKLKWIFYPMIITAVIIMFFNK